MSVHKSPLPGVHIPDNVSLPDLVFNKALEYGNKPALVDATNDRSYSFQEFVSYSRNVGKALNSRGVRKGDVVCIYAPNSIDYPIAFYGVTSIGAVLSPCSPYYTEGDLIYQLRDSGSTYLITVSSILGKAKAACAQVNQIKRIFLLDGEAEGCESLKALMEDTEGEFPHTEITPREDLVILPYSSGTTGLPKGVMLTHFNMVACLLAMSHPCIELACPRDRTLSVLPFYHMYAIGTALTVDLYCGSTNYVFSSFDLKAYLQSLVKYKITYINAVPPMILRIMQDPTLTQLDLSNLHTIFLSAAPFSKSSCEQLLRLLPHVRVRQYYGSTEATFMHVSPSDLQRAGSVGIGFPNTETKIIPPETDITLDDNNVGEILVRSPCILKGYLNKEKATRETITPDGWMKTGDLGYFDDGGHLYIIDRTKEIIKFLGLQVAPAELEGLLLTHPGVKDAAVIGVKDEGSGEIPKAFIVRKPNAHVTAGDVMQFVAERVSPHKKLRGGVEFVTKIPKSPSGKILRKVLRQKSLHTSKL